MPLNVILAFFHQLVAHSELKASTELNAQREVVRI
jgi:hypothetical protein